MLLCAFVTIGMMFEETGFNFFLCLVTLVIEIAVCVLHFLGLQNDIYIGAAVLGCIVVFGLSCYLAFSSEANVHGITAVFAIPGLFLCSSNIVVKKDERKNE